MNHNRYYLAISRSDDGEDLSAGSAERLAWLKKLENSGALLLSGPNTERTISVLLFTAEDLESAKAVVETDPQHVLGIRRAEVIEWEIHTGLHLLSGPVQEH